MVEMPVAVASSVLLAFVATLQHLPANQRAALILCEVLKWQASEAAELLMPEALVREAVRTADETSRAVGREPPPPLLPSAIAGRRPR